jgi:hypothetical protein
MLNLIRRIINAKSLSWLEGILWTPLCRFAYQMRVRAVLRDGKTPVLVYQMGKVASKTIVATLEQHQSVQVFHTHLLSPGNIKRRRRERDRASNRSLFMWEAIHNLVVLPQLHVKIITLVREPIGRNISAFFQGLDKRVGVEQAHINVPIRQLIDKFLNDYPHSRPLNWFDDELRDVTDIDVFSMPFPSNMGYQRIQQGRFDVLIMRHDLPDTQKAKCLGEFLDISNMQVVRDNLSENKIYHDCYREFQKTIRLSPEYVEEMLESKYARHFFPDEERELLRRKWLRLDDTRARGQETDKDTVRRLAGD